MQEVIRTLARYSPVGARYWRAHVWYRRGWFALIAYLYLLYLYLVGASLWALWKRGVSENELVTGSFVIILFLLIGLMPTIFLPNIITLSQFQDTADHLRSAALAGDDRIAPVDDLLIEEEPDSDEPLTSEEHQRVETFRHTLAFDDIDNLGYGIGVAAFGLLFTVAGRYDWPLIIKAIISASMTIPGYKSFDPLFVFPLLELTGPFLLLAAGSLFFWVWKAHRPLRLLADESGVRPEGTQSADPTAIAWNDVHAFWQISGVYILDTGDRQLTWTPKAQSQIGDTLARASMQANRRFCFLISKRTGLPLRDLTGAATILTKKSHGLQAELRELPSEVAHALAPLAPVRPPILTSVWGLLLLWLAPLGLYAVGIYLVQVLRP